MLKDGQITGQTISGTWHQDDGLVMLLLELRSELWQGCSQLREVVRNSARNAQHANRPLPGRAVRQADMHSHSVDAACM